MTTSERNRLNFRAQGGKPVSLYLDEGTIALLDHIERVEGLRNRSAAVRVLAALWAEQQQGSSD